MKKAYWEYERAELEEMCIERQLISQSEIEASFTKKHLIWLLDNSDKQKYL